MIQKQNVCIIRNKNRPKPKTKTNFGCQLWFQVVVGLLCHLLEMLTSGGRISMSLYPILTNHIESKTETLW
jgi:hypothetical protein